MAPRAYNRLLDPSHDILALIDFQVELAFGIQQEKRYRVFENAAHVARAAALFATPTFSTRLVRGPDPDEVCQTIRKATGTTPMDRSITNPWDHRPFLDAITAIKRERIIIAGLWTEGAVCFGALSALEEGYQVSVVTDAIAATTKGVHDVALSRMFQAGVVPTTARQTIMEWQRFPSRRVVSIHGTPDK